VDLGPLANPKAEEERTSSKGGAGRFRGKPESADEVGSLAFLVGG
jgi:hypothetical protein